MSRRGGDGHEDNMLTLTFGCTQKSIGGQTAVGLPSN